jgi:hypothetical protein
VKAAEAPEVVRDWKIRQRVFSAKMIIMAQAENAERS